MLKNIEPQDYCRVLRLVVCVDLRYYFITKARDIWSLRFWKCDRVEASPRGDLIFCCICVSI